MNARGGGGGGGNPTEKAGFEPRSAALEGNALSLGHQGDAL